VKAGELVEVGAPEDDDYFVGIVMDVCLPDSHRNGMCLIHVLSEGTMKWWPSGYVRRVDETR
jgi:hypothetical protein